MSQLHDFLQIIERTYRFYDSPSRSDYLKLNYSTRMKILNKYDRELKIWGQIHSEQGELIHHIKVALQSNNFAPFCLEDDKGFEEWYDKPCPQDTHGIYGYIYYPDEDMMQPAYFLSLWDIQQRCGKFKTNIYESNHFKIWSLTLGNKEKDKKVVFNNRTVFNAYEVFITYKDKADYLTSMPYSEDSLKFLFRRK